MVFTVLYFDGFRLAGGEQFMAEDQAQAVLRALDGAKGTAFELWRPGMRLHSFPAADPNISLRRHKRAPAAATRAPGPVPALAACH